MNEPHIMGLFDFTLGQIWHNVILKWETTYESSLVRNRH